MKQKIMIITGVIITILVLITLFLWMINTDDLESSTFISFVIILILVISAIYILWDRMKNLKKGLPAEDERLKLISYKAGYYGFIAAIWSAIISNILTDIIFSYELTVSQLSGIVVLFSGLVFIFTYLYMSQTGS